MATKNRSKYRRVSFGIQPNTEAAIRKLMEVTHKSEASIISDFLEENVETMLALARILELTKTDPVAALKEMQKAAEQGEKLNKEIQLEMLKN